MREEYTPPVGFAREPVEERKRWTGRIITLLLAAFIVWLGWTKVINPPEDTPQIQNPQTELPGPR